MRKERQIRNLRGSQVESRSERIHLVSHAFQVVCEVAAPVGDLVTVPAEIDADLSQQPVEFLVRRIVAQRVVIAASSKALAKASLSPLVLKKAVPPVSAAMFVSVSCSAACDVANLCCWRTDGFICPQCCKSPPAPCCPDRPARGRKSGVVHQSPHIHGIDRRMAQVSRSATFFCRRCSFADFDRHWNPKSPAEPPAETTRRARADSCAPATASETAQSP